MNELTNILAESVDRVFRQLMADGMPRSSDQAEFDRLWNIVEELGVINLLLPEESRGFDGVWQDAFMVFKQIGHHAVPLPVGETIVAKKLLQECDITAPEGAISIGTALESTLQRNGNQSEWRLTAHVPSLPWGTTAAHVLVRCEVHKSIYYALLSTKHCQTVSSDVNEAGEPRDTVRFVNAPIQQLACLESEADNLFTWGALLRACQAAGALEAALDMSIGYVQERKQFGRPLSRFQAVQHQIALLAEQCAAVNCAAQSACSASDRSDGHFEVAAAKLRANQAVEQATSIAHQVHGAIGFTREHHLHYFTQRLWSWRTEFGNDRHWASYLGQLAVQAGHDRFWPNLTAGSHTKR